MAGKVAGHVVIPSTASGAALDTGATDNAILRADGTGGATAQASSATINDNGAPATYAGTGPGSANRGLSVGSEANGSGFWAASGTLHSVVGNANKCTLASFGARLAGGLYFNTSNDSNGSTAAGVVVDATNVMRAENSSGSIAAWKCAVLVEANTAGVGTPNALAANESRTVLTNEGATAANYHTLPTAVAGYQFEFVVQDADGLRVTANTGDTIRVIDKVTAAAGYLESTTIGSVVRLVAINATEWIATSIHGTWTDGTFTYDDTSLTTP